MYKYQHSPYWKPQAAVRQSPTIQRPLILLAVMSMPPELKGSTDMQIEQAGFIEGPPRPDDIEEAKAASVFEVCFLQVAG